MCAVDVHKSFGRLHVLRGVSLDVRPRETVCIIGVYELFSDAEQVYSSAANVAPFVAVAFWYLVLTSIWSFVQALIERKLAVSEHGDEISLREKAVAIWTEGGWMVRSAWPGRARS